MVKHVLLRENLCGFAKYELGWNGYKEENYVLSRFWELVFAISGHIRHNSKKVFAYFAAKNQY